MEDATKSIFAGSCAGVTAKFFEYPFDTIKVRVQVNPTAYNGYIDCARKLLRNEGPMGFYTGLAAPTLGAGAENAVCFAGFALGIRLYDSIFGCVTDRTDTPIHVTCFGGAVSGVFAAHVLTPVELTKCIMQVEYTKPPAERHYTGVLDVVKQKVRNGGVKSLFEGHSATLLREIPGGAAWFGFYNLAILAQTPEGKTKKDLAKWQIAAAGGCGGVMYWTTFFPADVVKTTMQLDPAFAKKGFFGCLKHRYVTYGIKKGLYSGWTITAGRAFPGNAIIFSVFEYVSHQWDVILYPHKQM
eukprot:Tbor_TRINITY_DN3418_c0_g1::TRINITY_DN3418_c0_g1_i1::g.3750::m.3750